MSRRISDPDVLKALAQPLRQRLYRLLAQVGPATVTQLTQRLNADPGQISYHLRELAKRGFVEDVPELARDRRERWWRTIPGATSWSNIDFTEADGAAIAASVKSQSVIDEFERVRRYEQTRHTWSESWQQAAMMSDSFLRLTPDELAALNQELSDVLARWAAATRGRPVGEDDREHVFLFLHSFPERP